MAKFFKRIGTSKTKYALEIMIEKVELKLAVPTRVSITLKRGDHKVETKNAPVLEKGEAVFNEKLLMPVTFYQDKKSDNFQEKQAILMISIITKKGPKLAGQTKFDLAEYLNTDMREKNEIIPILKCMDKNAKFHFAIRLAPFDELQNDSGEGSEQNDSEADDKSKSDISQDNRTHELNLSDFDNRSGISQLSKDRNISKSHIELDKSRNCSPNKQIERLRDKSADKKVEFKPQNKNMSSKANLFGKKKVVDSSDSDSGTDSEKDSKNKKDDGVKTMLNDFKSRATAFFGGKKGNKSSETSSDEEFKREQIRKKDDLQGFRGRIKELETRVSTLRTEKEKLEKENKNLKSEYEDMKEDLEIAQKQNDSLTKLYQKSKALLDSRKEKNPSNSGAEPEIQFYKDRIDNLEQELKQVKSRSSGTDSSFKQSSEKFFKESQETSPKKYQELDKRFADLQLENEQLKQRVQELEYDLQDSPKKIIGKDSYDQSKKLNKDFNSLKEEYQTLKNKYDEHDTTISQLESQLEDKQNQIIDLEAKIRQQERERQSSRSNKKHNTDSELSSKYIQEISELEKKIRLLEETNNRKQNSFDKEIKNLKEELEKARSANGKEEEATADALHLERENLELKSQISKISEDLLVAKTNLGSVMNSVFEYGGPDLFDRIEEKISFGEH